MIVKDGMYCMTEYGNKVGPIRRTSQLMTDPWPFVCDCAGTDTGRLYIRTNGETQDGAGDYTTPNLISEWPTETGPVRTVTRKEIVPGVYGNINVGDVVNGRIYVGIDRSYMDTDMTRHGTVQTPLTAAELRAAAATLIEIADALEDK